MAAGMPLTIALIAGVALVGVALWASARGRGALERSTSAVPGPAVESTPAGTLDFGTRQ